MIRTLQTRNEIAGRAATRTGGKSHEALLKPQPGQCRKALKLTSVRLVACFTEEGHLYAWELAQ